MMRQAAEKSGSPTPTQAPSRQEGLWDDAAHISHSVCVVGEDGVEAGLFGAGTSGQTAAQ